MQIKINKNRLELSKNEGMYMLTNSKLNFFLHADALKLGANPRNAWLSFYTNAEYIGSVWIYTSSDIQKVKKFLEETK